MGSVLPSRREGTPLPSPFQMVLAFSQASLGSASTLVVMALLTKVLAVFGGPATLGLFSLLRQVQLTAVAVASSDGDRALVQGISAGLREGTSSRFAWTIGGLMAMIALVEAVVLWILAPALSDVLFQARSPDLVWALRLLALPVVLAVAATWLAATLKAHLAVGKAVLARTAGACAGLLTAIAVARQEGPLVLLLILAATEATAAILGYLFIRATRTLPPPSRWGLRTALPDVRAYLTVAGYLLVTGISRNFAVLFVRSAFLRTLGIAHAGFFEAAWTVAGKSLLFLFEAIGTYYLPLLSAADDASMRLLLQRRLTRLAWAVSTLAVTGLVVLKPLAIEVLYAKEFSEAITMLQWMVIGVYFQASSWPFSTALLAFGDARLLFRVDLAWMATFSGGSALALFVQHHSEGVGVAYLVASTVTFVVLTALNARRYGFRPTSRMAGSWALGLALVLVASSTTWSSTQVSWLLAAFWIALAGLASIVGLQREERHAILSRLLRKKDTT